VVLGIFSLNVEGIVGGVLQMINHGISTSALFLLVGFLYTRRHTREISDFGGIAKPMPVFAAFLGIVAMSSIGLPMLNGFVGELLILIGAYLHSPLKAAIAATGVFLAAAYMLWMVRRVTMGPVEHPENRSLIDLSRRERLVMLAMVIPIFWIGIYPDPFLRRIEPSAIQLLRRVDGIEKPEPAASESTAPPLLTESESQS
jgi:NADH-quinone oxidoreductase subunit M